MGRNFPRHQSVPSKHSPKKAYPRNSNTQSFKEIKLFVESLLEIPVSDDFPSVHDNDPLSVPRDEIQTMLNKNNGESHLSPEYFRSVIQFFCSPRLMNACRSVWS